MAAHNTPPQTEGPRAREAPRARDSWARSKVPEQTFDFIGDENPFVLLGLNNHSPGALPHLSDGEFDRLIKPAMARAHPDRVQGQEAQKRATEQFQKLQRLRHEWKSSAPSLRFTLVEKWLGTPGVDSKWANVKLPGETLACNSLGQAACHNARPSD